MIIRVKKVFFLLMLFVGIKSFSQSRDVEPFKDGDRVVFMGNSITHAGLYESNIWLYYMTHFPDRKIKIFNGGSGGDTAENMNARFEEDILRLDPSVVVLTFGMNDSGYMEFWESDAWETAKKRIEKSKENFGLIQEKLKAHSEITPVIMSSSPFDETAKIENSNNFRGKSKAIEEIVDFQKAGASENGWPFVDLYYPMKEITQTRQKYDSTYTITGPDRIHPGQAGHLVMAALFLKSQHLSNQPIANVEIDVHRKDVVKSVNTKIDLNDISDNAVDFDYFSNSLPFPIDSVSSTWGNPQTQPDALEVYPFIEEFNKELMSVKNLIKGDYIIKIDGDSIGRYSADDLSKGVNLALSSRTPQYKQAKNVMFLNDLRAEIEGKLREYYWAQFNYFKDQGMLFDDDQNAYDKANSEKEGFIGSKMDVYRTVRFPEIRQMWEDNMKTIVDKIYQINKPKTHRVRILPIKD